MKREIVQYGSQVLGWKCPPVRAFDQATLDCIQDLTDTLKASDNAVALAAPQIGIARRVFVLDISQKDPTDSVWQIDAKGRRWPREPAAIVNAGIVDQGPNHEVGNEGCMSLPDLFVDVRRWTRIAVECTDLNGKLYRFTARGFLARVIQHELDHLNGRLITDHLDADAPWFRRHRNPLKRIRRRGQDWDRRNPDALQQEQFHPSQFRDPADKEQAA